MCCPKEYRRLLPFCRLEVTGEITPRKRRNDLEDDASEIRKDRRNEVKIENLVVSRRS